VYLSLKNLLNVLRIFRIHKNKRKEYIINNMNGPQSEKLINIYKKLKTNSYNFYYDKIRVLLSY